MRLRLLLAITLGAWIAGTPFMWMVAMKNFAVVNRILEAPPPGLEQSIAPLSPEMLRPAARYQASEVNRLFFEGWGWAQLPLAGMAVILAWRSRQGPALRAALAATLLIALFLQLQVVPETIRLGERIDFDRTLVEVEETFWLYHHLYTGFDMLKFFLLLGSAVVLVRKG